MNESRVDPPGVPTSEHQEADDGFRNKSENQEIAQNKGRSRSNRRSVVLVVLGTILALLYGWVLPWKPLRWVGLGLWIPSEVLWIVARLQLGASFAVNAEAHTLITKGLYSRIENPIYVFGGMAAAGLMLYLNRPVYLLAFLIIVPMQIVRIRRERKLLMSKFGDLYLQYRSSTWF
ncbi:MAG: isoprenylcysteine carboxylmethyltransferase family protein [Edaphobacter sp.]